MDDRQFRQLLENLGLSWRGYRKVRKGVKKRIRRHMHHLGCRTLAAYLTELNRNKKTRQTCERLMSVSISRFFRDRKLWDILQKEILPHLIKRNAEKISVCAAGCASGEEVYSLRIIWEETRMSFGYLPELHITATDLNPAYLKRAKVGTYPSSSLKELPEKLRAIHFSMQTLEKTYSVNPSLKTGIFWQMHNFLFDPPGFSFDIILLRNNLLTYYQDETRTPALRKMIEALSGGGYLIIGSHEKLASQCPDLLPLPSIPYVFKKRQAGKMRRHRVLFTDPPGCGKSTLIERAAR